MPSKKAILVLFIVMMMLTYGCIFNIGCDLEKAKLAFKSPEARYKPEVLKSLNAYTALKDFLIKNKDTIFAFNHAKLVTIRVKNDGKKDTIANRAIDYLSLFDYGPGNMIKNQIPTYLYPRIRQIYKALNPGNFYAVSFERNGNVTISVTNPSLYNKNQIGIQHRLSWDTHQYAMDKDNLNGLSALFRDTLLSNGAKYTVAIDCYSGI